MECSKASAPIFKINPDLQSTPLEGLVYCEPEKIFNYQENHLPIALNLTIHKHFSSDDSQLLNKEISLYAEKLGTRKALIMWLRGAPLKNLNAAEITEMIFLTASNFQMSEDYQSQYGFECTLDDINKKNLALMKGLRFTTLLIDFDTTTAIDPKIIRTAFLSVISYKFREIYCRIKVSDTDVSKLYTLLDIITSQQPSLIEITELKKATSSLNQFSQVLKVMHNYGYILIGDRFFVLKDHPLVRSKKKGTLRYAPISGISHLPVNDWISIGIGTFGKINQRFYQNVSTKEQYQKKLAQEQLPICCGGLHPDNKSLQTWEIAERLYCTHQASIPESQISTTVSQHIQDIFENACRQGWMRKSDDCFILNNQGLNHIKEICHTIQNF